MTIRSVACARRHIPGAEHGRPHAAQEDLAGEEYERAEGKDERGKDAVEVVRVEVHRSTSAFRTGGGRLTRCTNASTGSFTTERRGWGTKPMATIASRIGASVNHSRTVRSGMPCSAALRGGPKKTRWYIQSM